MSRVSGMLTNCPVTGEMLSVLTPAGKGEEKSSRKSLCESARRTTDISKPNSGTEGRCQVILKR